MTIGQTEPTSANFIEKGGVPMDKINVEKLQKEMDSLGILNIEASGEFTPSCVQDAVDVVKSINLDFHQLAEQAKEKRRHPLK